MNFLRQISVLMFLIGGAPGIIAQVSDTSIFFRYASTFDQLLPQPYYPLQMYVPDSASIHVFNGTYSGRTMEKSVSMQEAGAKSPAPVGRFVYQWDKEGRLTNYNSYNPVDTVPYEKVRVQYLIGHKASDVYYSTPDVSDRIDTVSFQFNRMGVMGNWSYRSYGATGNDRQNGNRLYDSRARVIVATNMMYGPLRGSFTYEYNQNGDLIRRTFNAGQSGVVLCTDTIEYITQVESIVLVNHLLKIAGSDKWTLLESKTIYPFSNVILTYTDYNDADTNFLYQNFPEYTVRYEYDGKGRVEDEVFGTTATPDLIHAKYYYGKYDQPDSIVYSERVIEKKTTYVRVYSRDIRVYDETSGLISTREISTILYDEQKKKDKLPLVETIYITYRWR